MKIKESQPNINEHQMNIKPESTKISGASQNTTETNDENKTKIARTSTNANQPQRKTFGNQRKSNKHQTLGKSVKNKEIINRTYKTKHISAKSMQLKKVR